MNCIADCGNQDVPVYKTIDDGFMVSRIRWCQCGARWRTDETTNKATLVMAPRPVISDRRRSPVTTGDRMQSPVVTNDGVVADDYPLSIENHNSISASQGVAASRERGFGGLSVPVSSALSDPVPASGCSQPPIRGEFQSDEPHPGRRRTDPAYSPSFLSFWAAYPRKEGKGAAWARWDKMRPPLDAVLAALAWQCVSEQWRKEGGAFIPQPAPYLHARRWEDERPAATPPDGRAPLSQRERQNATAIEAFIARGGSR